MKKVLIILLAAFIIIQFFPIDKVNPPVNSGMDFIKIKNTPENIATTLRASCYDCHSDETVYPWYANVQPFGWFLKDHIDEGRKKLNFSTFATYLPKRQAHKLAESAEMVENKEMPLDSYVIGHPEADLTAQQRVELVQYFQQIEKELRLLNDLPAE